MNWHYLYIFFQSNGLEVLFLIFFYKAILTKKNKGAQDIAFVVTACNSITHPIVLFILLKGPLSYLIAVLIAESFAIISETFLHRYILNISYKKAFLGSLIANLISWQAGALLTTLFFLRDYV